MGVSSGIPHSSGTLYPFSEVVVHHNYFKVAASPTKKMKDSSATKPPNGKLLSWQPRQPSMIRSQRSPFNSPQMTKTNILLSSPNSVVDVINNGRNNHVDGGQRRWSTTGIPSSDPQSLKKKKSLSLTEDLIRTKERASPLFYSRSNSLSYVSLNSEQNGGHRAVANNYRSSLLAIPPPLTDSTRSLPTWIACVNQRDELSTKTVSTKDTPNWLRRRLSANIRQTAIKSRMSRGSLP